MFIITQKKTLTDHEAFSLYGLRRERGKTKFSPEKLIQAFGPEVSNGSMIFDYEESVEKQPRKGICVVRVGGLGDLIMLTSSLRKLKDKYPKQSLILATHPVHQRVFKYLSILDDCISVFDLHRFQFEKMIDLRWAVEPDEIARNKGKLSWKDYISLDRSDVFDKLCGVNSRGKPFMIPINEKRKQEITRIVGDHSPIIGFTPTCRAQHRAFPHDYVNRVVKGLTKEGKVVLFGKTESWDGHLSELKMPGLLNLLNKTSANQAIALCSILNLLITPDSGFLHVSGALGNKCLALFGNINPETRTSYYPSVKALYAKKEAILGCCPCWDIHKECKPYRGSAACMRLFTPEKIVGEARKMLNA